MIFTVLVYQKNESLKTPILIRRFMQGALFTMLVGIFIIE